MTGVLEPVTVISSPSAADSDSGRRRILVVGPGFHFLGGLSVYTCRLANALCADHDISVLLLDRLIPTRFYPGGHRAGQQLTSMRYDDRVTIAGHLDWYWGFDIVRAAAMLRRERPDMIVLQWWTAATLHTYLALTLVARRLGIPVTIEFHETQDTGEADVPGVAAYCKRLMPQLLSRVSGALVHHETDLELLRTTYGRPAMDRLQIRIAPHGPYDHLPAVTPTSPDAASAGCEAPTGSTVTRLLCFGLIRPYKGVEDVIAALDGMTPAEAARFHVTVVGETWEDWHLPADRIAASPYRDHITFVNRYVSDAEAAGFFADADALVLPYRRGSASGPLAIAMSAGLHTVLYAVDGLVEAVRSYAGATLVTPGSVDDLRTALLSLPDRRGDRFQDPHSWTVTSTAVAELVSAVTAT